MTDQQFSKLIKKANSLLDRALTLLDSGKTEEANQLTREAQRINDSIWADLNKERKIQ